MRKENLSPECLIYSFMSYQNRIFVQDLKFVTVTGIMFRQKGWVEKLQSKNLNPMINSILKRIDPDL